MWKFKILIVNKIFVLYVKNVNIYFELKKVKFIFIGWGEYGLSFFL